MKSKVNMSFIPKKIREIPLIEGFESFGFEHFRTTRKREIFIIPEHPDLLLIYNTDRVADKSGKISAELIEGKGYYITALQVFWLHQIFYGIERSLIAFGSMINDYLPDLLSVNEGGELQKRCLLVKKMDTFPVNLTMHGYLTRSEISKHKSTGIISGLKTPPETDLVVRNLLPEVTIFTSTKKGCNENINFEQMVSEVGSMRGIAEAIRNITNMLYKRASGIAFTRGIVISKSNLKMGTYLDQESDRWALAVTDEVFTPDSSMFALLRGRSLMSGEPLERYKVFTELLIACKLKEFWKRDMRIDL